MPRQRRLYVRDILPDGRPRLQIGHSTFWCPVCKTSWDRGGGKEGFVKSGASNHVHACFEIIVYQFGYMLGEWTQTRGQRVIPVEQFRTGSSMYCFRTDSARAKKLAQRWERSIQSNIRKRVNADCMPHVKSYEWAIRKKKAASP